MPYVKLDELLVLLVEGGRESGGTGSKGLPVVSGKGTSCQYGQLDSYALSEKIHELFYHGYHEVKLPHKFKIAVGGCPNNCVKPDLNDFGIVGQRIPSYIVDICRGCGKCQVEDICPMEAARVVDGKLIIDKEKCNNCGSCVGKGPFKAVDDGIYGYKVYIGGRGGKKTAHGKALSKVFTVAEEVLAVLEKAMTKFVLSSLLPLWIHLSRWLPLYGSGSGRGKRKSPMQKRTMFRFLLIWIHLIR